jgi:hypothetical protein
MSATTPTSNPTMGQKTTRTAAAARSCGFLPRTVDEATGHLPEHEGRSDIMSPQSKWIDIRVDVLLTELSDLGMSMSRVAAAELIRERVEWVATQMRIGKAAARPYLTDDAVKGLAESIAFSMAEEAPGADVLASPRTAEVPVAVVGRAEATLVRLRESDDVDHLQTTVTQLAHALSAVGQALSTHDDADGLPARFPPALAPAGDLADSPGDRGGPN